MLQRHVLLGSHGYTKILSTVLSFEVILKVLPFPETRGILRTDARQDARAPSGAVQSVLLSSRSDPSTLHDQFVKPLTTSHVRTIKQHRAHLSIQLDALCTTDSPSGMDQTAVRPICRPRLHCSSRTLPHRSPSSPATSTRPSSLLPSRPLRVTSHPLWFDVISIPPARSKYIRDCFFLFNEFIYL